MLWTLSWRFQYRCNHECWTNVKIDRRQIIKIDRRQKNQNRSETESDDKNTLWHKLRDAKMDLNVDQLETEKQNDKRWRTKYTKSDKKIDRLETERKENQTVSIWCWTELIGERWRKLRYAQINWKLIGDESGFKSIFGDWERFRRFWSRFEREREFLKP
jgi:hypothetical protein